MRCAATPQTAISRRPLAICIFLPLFIMAGVSGCDGNWHSFQSRQWKFSARFPGPVTEESQQAFAEFNAVSEKATFRIMSAQVSPLPEKKARAELLAMRDGSAKSLGTTAAESKNMTVQGEPAIEFTLSFTIEEEEMVSYTRYIRSGNRLHQLIVTAPANADIKGEVRIFLESFHIEAN
jgi:hypothetical protein